MEKSMKKKAFTLAEVLITLGIIGVVAALTMPALIANYQKKIYVTQLKKTYVAFQQAFLQYKAENGLDSVDDLSNYNNITPFITSQFKGAEICSVTTPAPCFADSYTHLNGDMMIDDPMYPNNNSVSCFRLLDGTSACIGILGWYTYTDISGTHPQGSIIVDINGRKGPNVIGRDAFRFMYYADGSVDAAYATPECKRDDQYCTKYSGDLSTVYSGMGASCLTVADYDRCFNRIIADGWKMTY